MSTCFGPSDHHLASLQKLDSVPSSSRCGLHHRSPVWIAIHSTYLLCTSQQYVSSDWGFSMFFPQLKGKCQGITRKDGARRALFPVSSLCYSMYCLCRLCCSVYCLCVNVYCTTATGCQPNCDLQIYRIILQSCFSAVSFNQKLYDFKTVEWFRHNSICILVLTTLKMATWEAETCLLITT
jgi:hypothetical protein